MGKNYKLFYEECKKTLREGMNKNEFYFRDEDIKKLIDKQYKFEKLGKTCSAFICMDCEEITGHIYCEDGVQCSCKKHLLNEKEKIIK